MQGENRLSARKDFNKPLLLVDLDGTITNIKINNTFDFLKYCYDRKFGEVGLILYTILNIITSTLMKILSLFQHHRNYDVEEALLLLVHLRVLSIFGLNYQTLMRYSYEWVAKVLKEGSLRVDILLLIKKWNAKKILFTACIDVVACTYARILKFDGCLARSARLSSNIQPGLQSKLLSLKHILESSEGRNIIYVLDSSSYERERTSILKFINNYVIV